MECKIPESPKFRLIFLKNYNNDTLLVLIYYLNYINPKHKQASFHSRDLC
jgi:hypothetical protein